MIKIHKQIVIDAPVEDVFGFLTTPQNLPEVWPSMVTTYGEEPSPVGGVDYEWQYKMAGITFHGATRTLEFEPNARVVLINEEGIPSKFYWNYSEQEGGTLVDMTVEYEIPLPVLGKLAEKVVRKINENEAETLLANTKAALELEPAVSA